MKFITPSHEIARDILLGGLTLTVIGLILTFIINLIVNRGRLNRTPVLAFLLVLAFGGLTAFIAPFALIGTKLYDTNNQTKAIERVYGVSFDAQVIEDLGYPHFESSDELVTYGIARNVKVESLDKTSDIILIWKESELRVHLYSNEKYLGEELPRL